MKLVEQIVFPMTKTFAETHFSHGNCQGLSAFTSNEVCSSE